MLKHLRLTFLTLILAALSAPAAQARITCVSQEDGNGCVLYRICWIYNHGSEEPSGVIEIWYEC